MNDGVFTIPLIADLCLEDFDSPCAPVNQQALPRTLHHQSAGGLKHANGSFTAPPNFVQSAPRECVCLTNNSHANPSKATSCAPLANGQSASVPVASRLAGSFIAGPENRLLAEAVNSLLHESPSPYNPLVLYGPPGTGKSHIARGMAQQWQSQHGEVIYTHGADFARSLAGAIENQTAAAWRALHRGASFFVLEDLTQLAGKTQAINELLHTLDAIVEHRGQVLLTSRLSPHCISGLPGPLLARLTAGLMVNISLPAAPSRLAMLERFAGIRGCTLPESALRLLAESLTVTAPELFGAMTELSVHSEIKGQPISLEQVRAYLAARRGAVRPTVRAIATLSARHFGLKLSELTSPTRRRAVVEARNVAIYLARHLAGKSLQQLGAYFGGRDHTTILHGYRTIEARSRTDPSVRKAISELRQMLAHG